MFMKRVVLTGVGGQSVRVISHVLALALKELGYQVSLLFDYDSSIRNTRISAHLIYDQKPIDNPMIDESRYSRSTPSKKGINSLPKRRFVTPDSARMRRFLLA